MADGDLDVLLVEDNPVDAELTVRALQMCRPGCRVETVHDASGALELLFGNGTGNVHSAADIPRLILLDLKLPRLGGLELLQRLKGDPRTRALPVVALTASRLESDVAASYRLGANGYLVKPVDFDVFLSIVRSVTDFWLGANLLPRPDAGTASGARPTA